MKESTWNAIAAIIAAIIWIFIIYLIACIIGWSFSPGHWIGFGRFLFGIGVFSIICYYIVTDFKK